jgi:hypothetical protein
MMNMNKEIDRIIKGYKPRSDKKRYWILYYLLELTTIMRLKFSRMLEVRKLESSNSSS